MISRASTSSTRPWAAWACTMRNASKSTLWWRLSSTSATYHSKKSRMMLVVDARWPNRQSKSWRSRPNWSAWIRLNCARRWCRVWCKAKAAAWRARSSWCRWRYTRPTVHVMHWPKLCTADCSILLCKTSIRAFRLSRQRTTLACWILLGSVSLFSILWV